MRTPRTKKMEREFVEVIAYAIAAYRKSIQVSDIFTATPSDANGYLARFIEDAIRHHVGMVDDKDAARYRVLRSGVGRDHKHHSQRCVDVMVCDWGKNLGRTGINAGLWAAVSVTGDDLDIAVDALGAL